MWKKVFRGALAIGDASMPIRRAPRTKRTDVNTSSDRISVCTEGSPNESLLYILIGQAAYDARTIDWKLRTVLRKLTHASYLFTNEIRRPEYQKRTIPPKLGGVKAKPPFIVIVKSTDPYFGELQYVYHHVVQFLRMSRSY